MPIIQQSPQSLLLVEDDHELAELISDYLNKNGFSVNIESNGITATQRIVTEQPDMVILDIMLPGLSGMEVCKQARLNYTGPILMLTALDEDIDQMLGLELGADDYVIKPVKPRMLLTRIRTLLRRSQPSTTPQAHSPPNQLVIGSLIISTNSRTVSYVGEDIDLSTAEYDLLLLLAHAAGKVVERDEIIQQLRGFDYDGFDRSIDRRVSRLRKKLHDDSNQPKLIKTIRGKGYQLCEC